MSAAPSLIPPENTGTKLFVPGRVCLFGEHSDWASSYRRFNNNIEKGYCIVAPTNQGISAEVWPHPTSLIVYSRDSDGVWHGPVQIPMEAEALLAEASKGTYYSYMAGVAYQVLTHYRVRGLIINNYDTSLPMKKGLSSSAAVTVLTARAFNRIYDLKMSVRGEMELAYLGEIETPSRCGRMDQGCAYGAPVLMTFDGDRLTTAKLHVGSAPLHYVIVDLKAAKDTIVILRKLNRGFPYPEEGDTVAQGVHRLLGVENARIVRSAIQFLQASDAASLGQTMREAQGLFDDLATPACPEELTAPVLHRVLNFDKLTPHIFGGKGIGSQGDGSAQFLCKSREDQDAVCRIITDELKMECLTLTLSGGRRVRKAVIPAGGFTAALFPSVQVLKAELLPVVDRDGLVKPSILLNVEQLLDAGIEEVIVIVAPGDEEVFTRLFESRLSPENQAKLDHKARTYAAKLSQMGQRVKFVKQQKQEGLGHAVLCAREAIGDEAFVLMLGDHLYRSDTEDSCVSQLLAAYGETSGNVLALRRTHESAISDFGAATGVWQPGSEDVLTVTELKEKPTSTEAHRSLRVPNFPAHEFLTVFGLYVLSQRIFEILDENYRNNIRQNGLLQLTAAIDQLREREDVKGVLLKGTRFDIGNPIAYKDAIDAFCTSASGDSA